MESLAISKPEAQESSRQDIQDNIIFLSDDKGLFEPCVDLESWSQMSLAKIAIPNLARANIVSNMYWWNIGRKKLYIIQITMKRCALFHMHTQRLKTFLLVHIQEIHCNSNMFLQISSNAFTSAMFCNCLDMFSNSLDAFEIACTHSIYIMWK